VNDTDSAARNERSPCFPQEAHRILDVEDVEEHRIADARIRPAASGRDEVSYFDNHIRKTGTLKFAGCLRRQVWFDVDGEYLTSNQLSGREGEGSISTAEFQNVPA
jgi:hypothetical protein